MIKLTGMDLSGYMCKDAARAMEFYRKLFGIEPFFVYPGNRGAEYELPDGSLFGLWGAGNTAIPFQPSNGILFAVDDFDAAVAEAKKLGVDILMQLETPVCKMAMVNDSEGNTVTLHQRKAN